MKNENGAVTTGQVWNGDLVSAWEGEETAGYSRPDDAVGLDKNMITLSNFVMDGMVRHGQFSVASVS